ncbi:Sodium:sulfate symporter transmembrane region family protein [Tritrichomonas foetus]|uniref:Sodium:sulfate symporter transmembrane region family protein n=1 Tax=Tritrichomonas foetus TaxID=1144522 RepID=A0A1J4JRF0_9EUKA|nr:Sodium:sulfate symporter transmembrane region family protein [Tritrichomonas foetus]|eukprot:OHT01603.1 Sodium:sulfate symporter transmembrane region family protein [Tritrichomonas foetus]
MTTVNFEKQYHYSLVDDWAEYYIQYPDLKKLIDNFQDKVNSTYTESQDTIATNKLREDCLSKFMNQVTENTAKFRSFFLEKYSEVYETTVAIKDDIKMGVESSGRNKGTANNVEAFKKRILSALILAYQLGSFVKLNMMSLQKLASHYSRKLADQEALGEVSNIIFTAYDIELSIEELIDHVNNSYVYLMRKYAKKKSYKTRDNLISDLNSLVEPNLQYEVPNYRVNYDSPLNKSNEFATSRSSIRWIPMVISYILLLPFEFVNFFNCKKFSKEMNFTAQKCLGILVMCLVQWIFQAAPIYITAFHIPVFGVITRCVPIEPFGSLAGMSSYLQNAMMSSTMFLIIGGMVIGQALVETDLQKTLSSWLLKKASSSPRAFIATVTILNAFLAMWVSSCASTNIICDLILPVLRQVPTDSSFAKSILIGIAFGGNFGGFMCSLAATHNPLAMQAVAIVQEETGLKGTFGIVQYLATGFPFGVVCLFIFIMILIYVNPTDVDKVPRMLKKKTDFGWRQIVVLIVSILDVIIWCVDYFYTWFGDAGIIGLLPILVFYGTGILPMHRIFNLPWGVLLLVMGGNSLIRVMQHSGLLDICAYVFDAGIGRLNQWVVCLIIDLVAVFITYFLTQTISTMIYLPIVSWFAGMSPTLRDHLRLFAMQGCLAITATMILPITTYSNTIAMTIVDSQGVNYIKRRDIFRFGIISTILCIILLLSLQYGISLGYGL